MTGYASNTRCFGVNIWASPRHMVIYATSINNKTIFTRKKRDRKRSSFYLFFFLISTSHFSPLLCARVEKDMVTPGSRDRRTLKRRPAWYTAKTRALFVLLQPGGDPLSQVLPARIAESHSDVCYTDRLLRNRVLEVQQ